MSRLTELVRFVLALVAFLWLSAPFAGLLTPPDPFTQIIALGVGAVGAVPAAVVFVRRSHSLERLYGYLLAANVLVIPVAFIGAGVLFLLRTALPVSVSSSGLVQTIEGALLVSAAYLLAFHLVYRGGYARLKTRFA
ncbi:hypothetical protein [Halococcus hamelinensis]|uniref:Uncharacterized protein n=1 Tax=Halococcus hamelinensis 100A6 TaxID=1132509 RepID=M0M235_9EURY|nr:hypothetical protein [Halococcus hamelinensis]EMA38649.1 hypothetical protein C447_08930 [Halococcus hamelinensis 100A6]